MPKQASRRSGFTIIEILIVLVLTGIILLAVFYAVPSAQRTQRNNQFKTFARQTATQLDTYNVQHNLLNPQTPDEMCDFITNYMQEINPGMDACSPVVDVAKECILVSGGRFTVCYHEASSAHDYQPSEDELSIQLSHKCNPYPGDPIVSTADVGDGDSRRYVIWYNTEGGKQCLDNTNQ